jgi:hypothetical protein
MHARVATGKHKPQSLTPLADALDNAGYRYLRTTGANGQKLRVVRGTGQRTLTAADEAMAFAVQSPTKTVGADGRTRGAISQWVDLSNYGFDSVHSAEFLFTIQATKPFYTQLLQKLDVLLP